MEPELFQKFAISLGLGLLVGLQRQHQNSQMAGIRTFPLITLFGSLSALLAAEFGGWVIAAGVLSMALLSMTGNYLRSQAEPMHPGQTTELAMLLMYAIGVYLVLGSTTLAVVLGGSVAVLLQMKGVLHRFVERIGQKDMKAIMQFAVISLVILPVLPNRAFGPYNALNLYETWLMVALIVGIGLLGYFAYKIFGEKAGTVLGGILGGLISSTATTVTYARRTEKAGQGTMLAALVIFIASVVSVIRVISEIVFVAPGSLPQVLPPFVAFGLFMIALAAVSYFFKRSDHDKMPAQENPAHFKTALVFGLVYAAVTLATAFAKDKFGSSGVYGVAIISGLTDVDAITLSTSRLMHNGKLQADAGWRIILVAVLSNLAFKAALTGILGNRKLFARVGVLFGLALAAGLLVLFFWPEELNLF
ncbi:MgtC/SapB family protein [Adhaeribacter soli]|uniref:MgtC/SapB family protein n=1 Tax=Adhaeribacter soli TaxID=2607655 RepID=A0A5N1IJP4_9BACT|nr:MgtC/SapB family protein [Adhaeribacter soli]KAA9325628.1 MgtC/SapB family protein [Adhaeribacter soli]